jgi:hypothetical protein
MSRANETNEHCKRISRSVDGSHDPREHLLPTRDPVQFELAQDACCLPSPTLVLRPPKGAVFGTPK